MELPKPILVAAGGVAGATLRWAIGEATDSAPVSLLVVNIAGALLFGAIVFGPLQDNERLRLLLGFGFCGALTTFSTLTFEVAARLDDGRMLDAAGVGLSNLGLGLIAVLLGASTRRVVLE